VTEEVVEEEEGLRWWGRADDWLGDEMEVGRLPPFRPVEPEGGCTCCCGDGPFRLRTLPVAPLLPVWWWGDPEVPFEEPCKLEVRCRELLPVELTDVVEPAASARAYGG
jgi:hypothetical protein